VKSDQIIEAIINSLPRRSDHEIVGLVSKLLVHELETNASWILVSFAKSEHKPVAQILLPYKVRTRKDELLLQRGPFTFQRRPPQAPIYLTSAQLRTLAGQRLAGLFPAGALYLPVPSIRSPSPSLGAGALLVEANEMLTFDQKTNGIAQLALSISLALRNQTEADQRIDENVFATLSRNLQECKTRRETCALILESINQLLPFQAGVLYLLDVNPGTNQYLIYGSSKNENPKELYRSFISREALGFTWEAAMKQVPITGSNCDVPPRARRTNDRALKHVGDHEAWALLPFTSNGRTVGIAHLEGLNHGEGSSGADLEIMRRLISRVGTVLHRCLSQETPDVNLRASSHIIEELFQLIQSIGPQRHKGFEDFVCRLFSSVDGVQQIPLNSSSRNMPQMDGLFLMKDPGGTLVIEVKAPERDEAATGVQALRQLTHQMDAIGGRLGILVSVGTFSSRTIRTVIRHPILVLDRSRLERMCVLSTDDRKQNLVRWFSQSKPGVELAEMC